MPESCSSGRPVAHPLSMSSARGQGRTVKVMRVAIVLSVGVLGLVCVPAVAVGATGQGHLAAAGWKLVRVNTLPRDDVLNDVTVLGNGSVWAAGHRVVNGRQRGLVQSFNGGSWRVIPNAPAYELRAVTATSNSNVWVFGQGK